MAAIMLTGRPGLWMGARTLVVLLLIVLVAWAFIESVRATRHIRVPLVSVAPVAGSSDRRI